MKRYVFGNSVFLVVVILGLCRIVRNVDEDVR